MQILIDADGCPVVDITVRVAKSKRIPCLILCDTSHVFNKDGAETIVLSKGPDSVDFALVNRVQKSDVVITQDYGLAAMCLAKQASVLNQNGLQYTSDNIDSLLQQRHNARKIRSAGGHLKGPAKRTDASNEAFEQALHALLEKNMASQ